MIQLQISYPSEIEKTKHSVNFLHTRKTEKQLDQKPSQPYIFKVKRGKNELSRPHNI